MDRRSPSPRLYLLCLQLPNSSFLPWYVNRLPSFNSMSDFDPTSIHTFCAGHRPRSPTPPSHLPRPRPGPDADRAMGYLTLQDRWQPTHGLAFDPHTQPYPSVSHAIEYATLVTSAKYVAASLLPHPDRLTRRPLTDLDGLKLLQRLSFLAHHEQSQPT